MTNPKKIKKLQAQPLANKGVTVFGQKYFQKFQNRCGTFWPLGATKYMERYFFLSVSGY